MQAALSTGAHSKTPDDKALVWNRTIIANVKSQRATIFVFRALPHDSAARVACATNPRSKIPLRVAARLYALRTPQKQLFSCVRSTLGSRSAALLLDFAP
jgi:hypothetical protein